MTARAAFDLGTLSTRMLVEDEAGNRRRSETLTRMGDGLSHGGSFDDAALGRVRTVLAGCRSELPGDARIVAVATQAARVVVDPEPLRAVVRETLGVELRILDTEEEGRLAFAGVADTLPDSDPVMVIDIGGGSTEFTVGSCADGVLGTYSAPMGALSIREAYLHSDPPRADELSAALSVIELHLADVVREVPFVTSIAEAGGPVLLCGGTAGTAAAVEMGLAEPTADDVDGFVLDRAAAEDVFRTLATERAEDRAWNPGLAPERVDVIVGGLCILVETMRTLGLGAVTVSVADLLEGLLAGTEEAAW